MDLAPINPSDYRDALREPEMLARLERNMRSVGVSRRAFLSFAATVAGTAALAACGGGTSPTATSAPTTPPSAAAAPTIAPTAAAATVAVPPTSAASVPSAAPLGEQDKTGAMRCADPVRPLVRLTPRYVPTRAIASKSVSPYIPRSDASSTDESHPTLVSGSAWRPKSSFWERIVAEWATT